MKHVTLTAGYIPLVDAAPLIVAREMGFAAEEGVDLRLEQFHTWSALRDMLSVGRVQAAHMLAAAPVASALGIGGSSTKLEAIATLSINGNVIGVSREIAASLKARGYGFDFHDARKAGEALLAVKPDGFRIGVPFPFSMHAELVFYWLSAVGFPAPQGLEVRTVPPPLMATALDAGEVDAFCVGEPWGSKAVENGVGSLLLPGSAIWAFAPEKVLATRAGWAEENPDIAHRVIRFLWRAGRWLSQPASRMLAAEILSRPKYLDLSPDILERPLTGKFVIGPEGQTRDVARFVEFHKGAASFPWRSQADWIARQMAGRLGLDQDEARAKARAVFRSDIHRAALTETEADLPSASSKIEGALHEDTAVASGKGRLILSRDTFFDGRVFEPRPAS